MPPDLPQVRWDRVEYLNDADPLLSRPHAHCVAGAEKPHDLRAAKPERAEAGRRVERLNRGLVPRLDRGGRVIPGLQAR
jgi:hypothetical protein